MMADIQSPRTPAPMSPGSMTRKAAVQPLIGATTNAQQQILNWLTGDGGPTPFVIGRKDIAPGPGV